MLTPDDSVATVTAPFQAQRASMQICHDLMGGTPEMRKAGERYIPRNEGEDVKTWRERVDITILVNVYKRTLHYLCGRIFERAVALAEDASPEMTAFCEDVDHLGSNLTVWSRGAFEAGLNDGVVFCVVDFNAVKSREVDGRKEYLGADGKWADRTEAAAVENGWGPYFVRVDAGQVLDCRVDWHLGKPRIKHFRYIEACEKDVGRWNVQPYNRIRAYFLDENGRARWEVYSNGGEDQTVWQLEDEGEFSVGVIPVAIFMPGEKKTSVTAEPALIDLAYLNVRYWQSTSAHYNLMNFNWLPVWFAKVLGILDHETGKIKITFGPGRLVHADDPSASLQSISVDAGSVAAGRQELKDLEDRMSLYGLQLLQPKTGAITATESLRDSEENNSTLKAWALVFQDFLENCFKLVAMWRGEPDGPSVVVNTDFASATDAEFYINLCNAGVISAETLLTILKGKGVLPDDFNVVDELARLAKSVMINDTGSNDLAKMLQAGGL